MSHTSTIEILKGQIRGLNRLLEEATRLQNEPHFRIQAYQRQLHEAQTELRRREAAPVSWASNPWDEDAAVAPRPARMAETFQDMLREYISPELIRQAMESPSRLLDMVGQGDAWRGADMSVPIQWGARSGRFSSSRPNAQSMPRELTIWGSKIVADPHAPDHCLYITETHFPIRRPGMRGMGYFDFDRVQVEDCYERVTVPPSTYVLRDGTPGDGLVDAIAALLRHALANVGHEVHPDIVMSPRNYATLIRHMEEQGWHWYADPRDKPPTKAFPEEVVRFEEQMIASLTQMEKSA